MIPVSGSAYTYSYATLGEIIAWIIGWDLILEYAVGNMAVAVGLVRLFCQAYAAVLFGLTISALAVTDHKTAATSSRKAAKRSQDYSSTDSARASSAIPSPSICPRFSSSCRSRSSWFTAFAKARRTNSNRCHHQDRGRRFLHCLRLFYGQSDKLAPIHAERFSAA